MRTVAATTAARSLPRLCKEIAATHDAIQITSHGYPVGWLLEPHDPQLLSEAIAKILGKQSMSDTDAADEIVGMLFGGAR